MKYTHPHKQAGFSHVFFLLLFVIAIIGLATWQVLARQNKEEPAPVDDHLLSQTVQTSQTTQTTQKTEAKPKDPDSASTIESPQKIATSDGKQYFYYGAPAGQNNASPKKILITMHGTEGSAERDYEVWKPFIVDTTYALATLNWWDGSGDQTSDYSTPETMIKQIHDFLTAQGYTAKDLIVYEGFSRGSANSYPIVAHDRASSSPMIDVAISSSGGAQPTYYDMTTKTIATQASKPTIFKGVYWILACGGKDENPTRDGCEAMETSKKFVTAKGGNVLGVLSDPNGTHGALTTSKLDLVGQAFDLIDGVF